MKQYYQVIHRQSDSDKSSEQPGFASIPHSLENYGHRIVQGHSRNRHNNQISHQSRKNIIVHSENQRKEKLDSHQIVLGSNQRFHGQQDGLEPPHSIKQVERKVNKRQDLQLLREQELIKYQQELIKQQRKFNSDQKGLIKQQREFIKELKNSFLEEKRQNKSLRKNSRSQIKGSRSIGFRQRSIGGFESREEKDYIFPSANSYKDSSPKLKKNNHHRNLHSVNKAKKPKKKKSVAKKSLRITPEVLNFHDE